MTGNKSLKSELSHYIIRNVLILDFNSVMQKFSVICTCVINN